MMGNEHPKRLHIWTPFTQISENMYLMVKHTNDVIKFAPLAICSFRLVLPRRQDELELYNLVYSSPDEIDNVGDKIKWYRLRKGFTQLEMAEKLNMDRLQYQNFEAGQKDYYNFKKLERVASILDVPFVQLLDEYHRFIYDGQGQAVLQLRKSLHLTQEEFGKQLGINRTTIKNWELEQDRMLKSSWEKVFKKNSLTPNPYHDFIEKGQGQQIKTLRKKLHFTQKQLASYVGVSRKAVIKWENEECTITKNNWQLLFCQSDQI